MVFWRNLLKKLPIVCCFLSDFFAACSLCAEGSKKDYEQETVGSSVGKIILLNDSLMRYEKFPTSPLGSAEAFLLFKQESRGKNKSIKGSEFLIFDFVVDVLNF